MQIVGLQKILNLREAEETNKKNYNTGIISRYNFWDIKKLRIRIIQ